LKIKNLSKKRKKRRNNPSAMQDNALYISGGTMKGLFVFCLVLALGITGGCAGLRSGGGEEPGGFYDGFGEGNRGPIHLRLQIGPGGDIREIEILEHGEDPLVGGYAMEELLEAVLSAGSADVDAVSGATGSSAGFLGAVEDAAARALGSPGG
jgi:hypothetical protein